MRHFFGVLGVQNSAGERDAQKGSSWPSVRRTEGQSAGDNGRAALADVVSTSATVAEGDAFTVWLQVVPVVRLWSPEWKRPISPSATTEFPFVLLLAESGARGCTRVEIGAQLWPEDSVGDRLHKVRRLLHAIQKERGVELRTVGDRWSLPGAVRLESSAELWRQYVAHRTAGSGALGTGMVSGAFKGALSSDAVLERWDKAFVQLATQALWAGLAEAQDHDDVFVQALLDDLVRLKGRSRAALRAVVERALSLGFTAPVYDLLAALVSSVDEDGLGREVSLEASTQLVALHGDGHADGALFIGRSEVVMTLMSVVRRRAVGAPKAGGVTIPSATAVAIVGASGMGKSGFLAFFHRQAKKRDRDIVMQIAFDQTMRGRPFSAMQVVARVGIGAPGAVAMPQPGFLLLTRLAQGHVDAGSLNAERLAVALVELFAAIADAGERSKPVIVVALDDVDFMDDESLAVWRRVAGSPAMRQLPVIVAMTASASADMARVSEAFRPWGIVSVELGPLDDAAVRRLLLRGAPVEDTISVADAAQFNRAARGSFGRVLQIATSLRGEGFAPRAVHRTMGEWVSKGLMALSSDECEVLLVLAMLGPVATWERAGVVLGGGLEPDGGAVAVELAANGWIGSVARPHVPHDLVPHILALRKAFLRGLWWVQVAGVLEEEGAGLARRLAGGAEGVSDCVAVWTRARHAWIAAHRPEQAVASGGALIAELVRARAFATAEAVYADIEQGLLGNDQKTVDLELLVGVRRAYCWAMLDVNTGVVGLVRSVNDDPAAADGQPWPAALAVRSGPEVTHASRVVLASWSWMTGARLREPEIQGLERAARATYLPLGLRASALAHAVRARWAMGQRTRLSDVARRVLNGDVVPFTTVYDRLEWARAQCVAAAMVEPARQVVCAAALRAVVAEIGSPRVTALIALDAVGLARVMDSGYAEVRDWSAICARATSVPELEVQLRIVAVYAMLRDGVALQRGGQTSTITAETKALADRLSEAAYGLQGLLHHAPLVNRTVAAGGLALLIAALMHPPFHGDSARKRWRMDVDQAVVWWGRGTSAEREGVMPMPRRRQWDAVPHDGDLPFAAAWRVALDVFAVLAARVTGGDRAERLSDVECFAISAATDGVARAPRLQDGDEVSGGSVDGCVVRDVADCVSAVYGSRCPQPFAVAATNAVLAALGAPKLVSDLQMVGEVLLHAEWAAESPVGRWVGGRPMQGIALSVSMADREVPLSGLAESQRGERRVASRPRIDGVERREIVRGVRAD